MADPTVELRAELNALLRLTQMEAMAVEARVAQARDEDTERELSRAARETEERASRLAQAVRDLGGVPDVVGATMGRAATSARTVVEQGRSLAGTLLADLALERQLNDRARFARVLAETADETKAVRLLQRIEEAHAGRIEWLTARLAEHAVGGPAAVRPTPVQTVVGVGRRIASFPARQAAERVNRGIAAFEDLQEQARETVSTTVDQARQVVEAVIDVLGTGTVAALQRGERDAAEGGARRTARTIHKTRVETGALSADELPIKRYDDLNASTVVARIRRLRDAEQVRAVLRYEQANKARKGVTRAAETQIEEVAGALAVAS